MAGVSTYTPELATTICERIAEGESLRKICADDDMPNKATVFRWLEDEANDGFRDQYARARDWQAESIMDEILEISDDTTLDTEHGDSGPKPNTEWISRSRLRVDSRFKLMGQLAPKRYGAKVAVTVTEGTPFEKLTDEEILDELRKLAPDQ